MRLILIAILIGICSVSFSQEEERTVIDGRVVQAGTMNGVSFTTVLIKGRNLGVPADQYGFFTLAIPGLGEGDSIHFSALGFSDSTLAVNDLLSMDTVLIHLRVSPFQIDGVKIEDLTARKMVERAIEMIPQNYHVDARELSGYYRQIHRENGLFCRGLEVLADVWTPGYKKTFTQIQEGISINAIRRTDVYELNNYTHGDHLTDLFLLNAVLYPIGGPLNRKAFGTYDYRYDSRASAMYGEDWEVINFSYAQASDKEIQTGFMVVNKQSFAIKEMVINSFPFPGTNLNKYDEWLLMNSRVELRYEKLDSVYHLAYARQNYNHEVWDQILKDYQFIVEEEFIWQTDSLSSTEDRMPGPFQRARDLYEVNYTYDPVQWESSRFAADTYPANYIKHMERRLPLEDQYIKNRY